MAKATDDALFYLFCELRKAAILEEAQKVELNRLRLRVETMEKALEQTPAVDLRYRLHKAMVNRNLKSLMFEDCVMVVVGQHLEVVEGLYNFKNEGETNDTETRRPRDA